MLLLPTLVGCHRLPDAPRELDQLMTYIFAHQADADPAPLQAASANLDGWLDGHLAATLEGYAVDDLSPEVVEALGAGEPDLEDLVGAAVGHESTLDPVSLALETSVPPDADVSSWGTEGSGRVYRTDPECYRALSCDFLEAEEWSVDQLALGIEVHSHWWRQWRWVETDAGTVSVARQWLLEPPTFNVDYLKVDAQYYTWIFLPREEGSVSVQSTWIVARLIGAPVPENVALNLVVDQMVDTAESVDARASD